MNIKKYLTIAVASAMLLSISACGPSDKPNESNTKTESTQKKLEESDVKGMAMAIIEDYFPKPKIKTGSMKVIGTDGLRRKIEGEVSIDGVSPYQEFVMIIEYTEDLESVELVKFYVGKQEIKIKKQ